MAADIRVSTVIAHRNKSLLGFVSVWLVGCSTVEYIISNSGLFLGKLELPVHVAQSVMWHASKSSSVACLQ